VMEALFYGYTLALLWFGAFIRDAWVWGRR
jgi:hypothetical protein